VLFIDASREFKAGKNQNQLSEENIKKIVKTYRDGDNVEKYAYLASLKRFRTTTITSIFRAMSIPLRKKRD
jgi:type I restriction enzyme M protein